MTAVLDLFTPEMLALKRRNECRESGHAIEAVVGLGDLAPQMVACGNCGTSWRIHPDDEGKAFDA